MSVHNGDCATGCIDCVLEGDMRVRCPKPYGRGQCVSGKGHKGKCVGSLDIVRLFAKAIVGDIRGAFRKRVA